ncbi:putative drug/metabolite transporter [Gottschalkia purinilytica]|uniref:Putative drug/metabolite transporter n=1 Tax=Gottschalkia purinilytica TaxID=1503 RepID=A0A0L0WAI8_GOTPU|nr:DMT family transporter [Gottschalkia purinilytica]KNF08335.1 putative drug/metabolite transporter [Gottschalkia purinilytica]
MKKNNNIFIVYMLAVLYAVIIGFSFLFTKIALKYSSPLDVLALRFAVSFIALTIPVALGWIKVRFEKKYVIKVLPLLIFYPTLFLSLQTFGLSFSSSSEAGIIQATTPIFTMVLSSLILNEKTNLVQKVSIFLSFFGVLYMFMMKGESISFNSYKGIIFLLLSCLSFSGYSILARKLSKDFNAVELTYYMITGGFIIFNIAAIGKHVSDNTLSQFLTPFSNLSFVLSMLYLGILACLVTSALTNYILSKIEASKMNVFVNLTTVVSIFAGAVFLKERIYSYHIIGSLMIIAGVIGANCFTGSRKRLDQNL